MTGSNRTRSSEIFICDKAKHSNAQKLPLAEEKLTILGHEIRNPLSALNYALEAWPSPHEDPMLADHLLEIMRRQVAQLTRLCNDLLDTGRSAQGSLAINKASIDLRQALQIACEEIHPFAERCGHTMTITLGDSPVVLFGDQSRLTQVFANLLQNSAKFTEPNGHLHISVERSLDVAIVRLRDNGRGMSVDKLRNIFIAPRESQSISKSLGEGFGIGLRLAKAIVELHSGTIEAISEGRGHGCTFVVRLPLATDKPKELENQSLLTAVGDRNLGLRLPHYQILVVDDERSMRFLVSRLLQKLKQSVTVAETGDLAIKAIIKNPPQVVFLDLQMRGMSGFEVAREIRSRVELNNVVLIALSGNANLESQQLASESGFDQYLIKPASIKELTNALSRVRALSTR